VSELLIIVRMLSRCYSVFRQSTTELMFLQPFRPQFLDEHAILYGENMGDETEKRLKPYALVGLAITTASTLVVFAIFVVFLVLFLRQVHVSIGGLVFFLVFFTLYIALLWKPFFWFLKVTHAREIYKDGRWQPRPERERRK